MDGLSPKQIKILGWIGDGLTMKEIAMKSGLKQKGAEYHARVIKAMLNPRSPAELVKMAIGFGLTTLCLMLCALPARAAAPTNTVPIVLAWDNPTNSSLVYRIYFTTNVATPTNQWPLLATVTNPVVLNGGASLAWTNYLVPGTYFFTMTSSNLWGTSFFSAAASSPPAPPLLNNLSLLPGL